MPISRAMSIFAARVRRVAESSCPARFGRFKVFISEIWRCEFSRELPLSEFKTILLDAHRSGAIVLSRADLTSAMDPVLVRDSLLIVGDPARPLATFHFVSLEEKWGVAEERGKMSGMQVQERGLTWSERRSDGIWLSQGTGGQYQLVPRRTAGGFHAWWLAHDGQSVDLGKHGSLAGAMGAAARFDPATGQVAAETPGAIDRRIARYVEKAGLGHFVEGSARSLGGGTWAFYVWGSELGRPMKMAVTDDELEKYRQTADEPAGECSCAHAHPPGVPSLPCPKHGAAAHAAEEGPTAKVLYEPSAAGETPTKKLRWHRNKAGDGYTALGRMGNYAVVQRKPDRRHGILPVALLFGGSTDALKQFDSVSAAKDYAQRYDEIAPFALRRQSNDARWAGEAPSDLERRLRADPYGLGPYPTVNIPPLWWIEYESKNGTTEAFIWGPSEKAALDDLKRTVKVLHVNWIKPIDRSQVLTPPGQNVYAAEKKGAETPPKKGDEGAASSGGQKTLSRHVTWTRSPRGFTGTGRVTGSFYKVDVHGRPGKHPVWTLMRDGVEDKRFFYNEDDAMRSADAIEAKAGDIPAGAETEIDGPPGQHAAEVPVAPQNAAPLVTLQRDFKRYEACSRAAKDIGPIDGPEQIWKLLARQMLRETQEVFVVIGLNIHDRLCDCPVEVARGGHSRVEVEPAIVCQAALASNADTILVCHQHPGSRPDPSDSDIKLTEAIEKAVKALGGSLKFREHFIISGKGVYSVKARKMWRAR